MRDAQTLAKMVAEKVVRDGSGEETRATGPSQVTESVTRLSHGIAKYMILKEPLKRRDSLSSDHLSRLESVRYCDSPAKTLGFRGSYYVLNHKALRRSVSVKNARKCHRCVTRKRELRGVQRSHSWGLSLQHPPEGAACQLRSKGNSPNGRSRSEMPFGPLHAMRPLLISFSSSCPTQTAGSGRRTDPCPAKTGPVWWHSLSPKGVIEPHGGEAVQFPRGESPVGSAGPCLPLCSDHL